MNKSMYAVYSLMAALILCITSAILPMQKGPQSLVNLAMAAYVKKILALETVPSQETFDKLMPKDLHPLIAQMLMKPVIEYVRDEKFRSPQVKSCKLPQKYKEVSFDNKGHFALLTDKEDKVYLVDIIRSMELSPESDSGMHIIASFDNQKIADLSRNGKFFAGVGMNNVVTVYSTASSEVLSIIDDTKFDVHTLDFNESGSRLFLAGDGNISVIDIPSGKKRVEYSNISEIWDFSGDENIVCLLKDDGKTMLTFDIENNKLLSQRIFDNDTVLDLSCFSDGKKCVLLFTRAPGEKQRIDIVSTVDLKTIQSFSLLAERGVIQSSFVVIELSPKNLFLLAEEPEFTSGLQCFIRVSDGKMFGSGVPEKLGIVTEPLNADETRAMFLQSPPVYLELIDLVNGKLVSKYSVYDAPIFKVHCIDNDNFLIYGRNSEGDCCLKLCTLLSPEVHEQLRNISLPQAWILRKIYEGMQNNSQFTLDADMAQIFFAMPEAIIVPFKDAIPLWLEKKAAVTENVPTIIPAIASQEQVIEQPPVLMPQVEPVVTAEQPEFTEKQRIETEVHEEREIPITSIAPETQAVVEAKPAPEAVSSTFKKVIAGVRSIWSSIQNWWGGQ